MLQHTDITTNLQTFWQQHGPQSVPCQFPGVPLDVNSHDVWMEFWITQIRQQTTRTNTCDKLLILIDIHCFSRHKTDKSKINKLVDEARATLKQRTITISDSEGVSLASIRFQEPITRDLTRLDPERTLQHQVLSLTATTQEIPPVM